MRILIVDGDLRGRCVLQALLAHRGTIDTAASGRDAVRLFAASLQLGQSYDLVCLDGGLPDMDGRTALRAIRALEAARAIAGGGAAKVLLTTAADAQAGAAPGPCEAYVAKPVERRALDDALQKIGFGAAEPALAR